jgi:2-dehydropantoate 2-reductase
MEVTSEGEFVVGRLDGSTDVRLEAVRDMLDAAAPTRISTNIMGELYSKLIVNSCINSLGVIAGVALGQLLAVRKIRKVFIAIMAEALAVADAMGLTVPPGGGGKLDYHCFLADCGWLGDLRRHLTIRLNGFKYRRIRSSSLQSLERGRKTEVDFLNGYICRQGRRHHVPTPVNDAVVAMIHEIEDGQRPISMANLDELG